MRVTREIELPCGGNVLLEMSINITHNSHYEPQTITDPEEGGEFEDAEISEDEPIVIEGETAGGYEINYCANFSEFPRPFQEFLEKEMWKEIELLQDIGQL